MSYLNLRSFSFPKAATWLLAGALALGLLVSGDKAVWSAGPGNAGVDPLEILNLAVRPNAIFVLDSSGSMGETPSGIGGLADDECPIDVLDTLGRVTRLTQRCTQTLEHTKSARRARTGRGGTRESIRG